MNDAGASGNEHLGLSKVHHSSLLPPISDLMDTSALSSSRTSPSARSLNSVNGLGMDAASSSAYTAPQTPSYLHSADADTSNVSASSVALLDDLLVTYSLLEAEPYQALSLEQVAELRRKQHKLSTSLKSMQERISLEKKMRGATHMLHAYKPSSTAKTVGAASTHEDPATQRDDLHAKMLEVSSAMERTDQVMQQFIEASDGLHDVQNRLLSHHVAVLRDHLHAERLPPTMDMSTSSSSRGMRNHQTWMHGFLTPRRSTSRLARSFNTHTGSPSSQRGTPSRNENVHALSEESPGSDEHGGLMDEVERLQAHRRGLSMQLASTGKRQKDLRKRLSLLCAQHTELGDFLQEDEADDVPTDRSATSPALAEQERRINEMQSEHDEQKLQIILQFEQERRHLEEQHANELRMASAAAEQRGLKRAEELLSSLQEQRQKHDTELKKLNLSMEETQQHYANEIHHMHELLERAQQRHDQDRRDASVSFEDIRQRHAKELDSANAALEEAQSFHAVEQTHANVSQEAREQQHTKELDQMRHSLRQAEQTLAAQQARMDAAMEELKSQYTKELDDVKQALKQANEEHARELDGSREATDKAQQQLLAEQNRMNESVDELKRLHATELGDVSTALMAAQQQLATERNHMSVTRDELKKQYTSELEEARLALERMQAAHAKELEETRLTLADTQEQLATERNDASAAIHELKKQHENELEEARRAVEQARSDLLMELDEARAALAMAQQQLASERNDANASIDELKRQHENELEEARQAVEQARSDLVIELDEARVALATAQQQLATQRNHANVSIDELKKQHDKELEGLRLALHQTQEEHTKELEASRTAHDNAQQQLATERNHLRVSMDGLKKQQDDTQEALEKARSGSERARDFHAKELEDIQGALDAMQQQLATERNDMQVAMDELRQQHAKELESTRAAMDESQRRHSEETQDMRMSFERGHRLQETELNETRQALQDARDQHAKERENTHSYLEDAQQRRAKELDQANHALQETQLLQAKNQHQTQELCDVHERQEQTQKALFDTQEERVHERMESDAAHKQTAKSLSDELTRIQAELLAHQERESELLVKHESELARRDAEHADTLSHMRASHADAVDQLNAGHAEKIGKLHTQHNDLLHTLRSEPRSSAHMDTLRSEYEQRFMELKRQHAIEKQELEDQHAKSSAALQARVAQLESEHATLQPSPNTSASRDRNDMRNQPSAVPTLSRRLHMMFGGGESTEEPASAPSSVPASGSGSADTNEAASDTPDATRSTERELRAQLAAEREQKDLVARRLEEVMVLYRTALRDRTSDKPLPVASEGTVTNEANNRTGPAADSREPANESESSAAVQPAETREAAAAGPPSPSMEEPLIPHTPEPHTPTTPEVPDTPRRLTRLETYIDNASTPTHRTERRTDPRARILEMELDKHRRAAEQSRFAYEQLKLRYDVDIASTARERELVQRWIQGWRDVCERLQQQHLFCMRVLGKADGREEMDGLLDQIKASSITGARPSEDNARDDTLHNASRLLSQLEEHIGDMAEGLARAGASGLGDNVIAQLEDKIEDLEEQLAAKRASLPTPVTQEHDHVEALCLYALVLVGALLPDGEALAHSMSLPLDALHALFAPPRFDEEGRADLAALPVAAASAALRTTLECLRAAGPAQKRTSSLAFVSRVQQTLDSLSPSATSAAGPHGIASLVSDVFARLLGTLDTSEMITERAKVLEDSVHGYNDTDTDASRSLTHYVDGSW